LRIDPNAIPGMKVTVMGLGLNGGGLASAQFFARRGAEVTVTDLRGREALAASLAALEGLPVRLVLGRHEQSDFEKADLVVKNPAVSPGSPFLRAAREHGAAVETDISIFLALAKNPVLAVTGSKGKSTTASAIAFGLARVAPGTRLGGNIAVSPLSFLDELPGRAPVVLELSSWQLGDLRGRGLLRPVVSAFTVILPDHLDKYPGMAEYVADKKAIFQEQQPGAKAVFNLDDPWQREFPRETRATSYFYSAGRLPDGMRGAWLEEDEGRALVADAAKPPAAILGPTRVPGAHNRMNLLCAGLALRLFGVKAEVVRKSLAEFPGVEHRLEMFLEWRGIRFYNDSAATIPHATAEAVRALEKPIVLIAGGTDKNLDFSPLRALARKPAAIVLLEGTATEKISALLDKEGVRYEGPFSELAPAVEAAIAAAGPGGSVLFSPGCTSFGMFLNEFDRGARFKRTVIELTKP
jgi:UDP-N-acetylmuramoylalanine--D-glutamate ligase